MEWQKNVHIVLNNNHLLIFDSNFYTCDIVIIVSLPFMSHKYWSLYNAKWAMFQL